MHPRPSAAPTTAATKKTRLCILLPTHWAAAMGGAEYQVKLILEYLADRDDFEIWYLARNINSDFQPQGYEIVKVGTSTGARYVMDAPGITAALKRIQPDVIYSRVGTAYIGVAAYYCQRTSCRLVWHVAHLYDVIPVSMQWRDLLFKVFDKLVLEYGLKRANHIIVQSVEQENLLRDNYARSATAVIRNFHPLPDAQAIKSGAVVVLWIGNLKAVKQPHIFVELAQRLQNTDAEFCMIGASQLTQRDFKKFNAQINQLKNLNYLGKISQDEVNAELSRGALLVNTSVAEGFSNTFIQAWMRKVPVVSLNADPDGLLQDTGLGAFAQGNEKLLADKVEELINDKQLREDMGERAQAFAYDSHAPANIEKLVSVLCGNQPLSSELEEVET